jgi:hypothetical protein
MTRLTSFRRTEANRIGASTAIRRTCQRIAGFQRTASTTPRAAEGVMVW